MTYQELKDIFVTACHEGHACTDGYKEVLAADNAGMLAMAIRHYWDDCYNGIFFDALKNNINNFTDFINDFAGAGIYINQSSTHGIVVVSNNIEKVSVHGDAECYAFDKCYVDVFENAQLYCKVPDSVILLDDKATAFLENQHGSVIKGNSTANLINCNDIICFNRPYIRAKDSSINAYEFYRIEASGATNVSIYGNTAITPDNAKNYNLILNDDSKITFK